MRSCSSTLLLALAGISSISAHSFVSNINIDLKSYTGFHPIPGSKNNPIIVGWATTASDQGWVGFSSYADPDIICHRNGANAQGHAPVAAGDKIQIQWNGWPVGHKGPVIDYLASCGVEGCQSINKTTLQFFKMNQGGLVSPSLDTPLGEWATDLLIANNNSWVVEIPPAIKPGFYVLRTEIIALHNETTGPQHYPQCLNLEIKGNGTETPVGVLGERLYSTAQPGLNPTFNITTGVTSYLMPGPTLISDAIISIAMSHPMPTGPGTPVMGMTKATSGSTATVPAQTAPVLN
jgi:cellulase